MEKSKQKRSLKVSFFFFLFILFFIVGIITVFLVEDQFIDHETFLRIGTLERLQEIEVDATKMLYLCIRERIIGMLLLILFAFTNIGNVLLVFFVSGMGCMAGMLLEVLSLRYGIKGILLFVAGVFPQYLFYSLAFILLLQVKYQGAYHRMGSDYHKGMEQHEQIKKVVQLSGVLFIVFVGVLAESYINPSILLQILKLF